MSIKEHWKKVYETKNPDQVDWTQEVPQTSLDFIHSFGEDKSASIIDVGGGDSHLVDCILDEGYTNISVLDISVKALERAKSRLGGRSSLVNWIISDIISFEPNQPFDTWQDQAVFHLRLIPQILPVIYPSFSNSFQKHDHRNIFGR